MKNGQYLYSTLTQEITCAVKFLAFLCLKDLQTFLYKTICRKLVKTVCQCM